MDKCDLALLPCFDSSGAALSLASARAAAAASTEVIESGDQGHVPT
jgi:hypothetical protein